MDKRSFESPMDWEYQNAAPMDPSSPFTRRVQDKNLFSSTPGFSAFGQAGFARTQSTPSKPLPPTPMQQQSPPIFPSARVQRTTTAPPFRNPAFTTPRKPFDIDLSEISAAESSPAATDGSDFPETPDHDQSLNMAHMTITPATMNKHRSIFPKRTSGKGEISKTVFPSRDKIRKRKRYNTDKDISGYRLPYIQSGEGDDSEYESDESTFQPNRQKSSRKKRSKDGWFGNFLDTIQRHPDAPNVLGYWLGLGFNVVCVTGTVWILWIILVSLRADFKTAQSAVRSGIVDEMETCRQDYVKNKCFPEHDRVPAVKVLCEEWFACMNKDPDYLKRVQLGAKNIVEIINEIVETMSYKTIILLVLLLALFLFSGRSLFKTAYHYPHSARHAPPPVHSQPHAGEHAAPQQVYWAQILPQTPRHNSRHLPSNDETPDTDVSPPQVQSAPTT
ncbi:hypothetical protein NUW58_g8403 [Xylaria curta]|uniref:Uncharacterized protein n=1 Tax=Xylaria curta TaxID=42375 RepID=A0ACC1N7Q4_9PEZI|nr:hypothetical protein NUW58_g8403 [Xylaria curta]